MGDFVNDTSRRWLIRRHTTSLCPWFVRYMTGTYTLLDIGFQVFHFASELSLVRYSDIY